MEVFINNFAKDRPIIPLPAYNIGLSTLESSVSNHLDVFLT